MTLDTKTYQLIVQQGLSSAPGLERLLRLLMEDFGLDAYIARTRLTGSGKALFGSGSHEKVAQLAKVLRDHAYDCWVIKRTGHVSQPFHMRELSITQDAVALVGGEKKLVLPRGSTVVAVLADVSGKLEERILKQHSAQRLYKASRSVTGMNEDKRLQSVLKGNPVLDLYLLPCDDAPYQSARIFPARYDARGLGERMTMSAVRNLEAIVALVDEYAGRFVLHTDFGLGRLPDCQIKDLDGKFLAESAILERLTRYGWLMCDLEQDAPAVDRQDIDPALAAVAMATGQPALAAALASGNVEAIPGMGEVVDELKGAGFQTDDGKDEEPVEQWLPAPPERPVNKLSLSMVLSVMGPALLGGLFAFFDVGNLHYVRVVGQSAMKAGVVPAIVSIGLFWAGFHFVLLKRKVENTPTSRIRSVAMGLVEVHGRAKRKYALVSPMSQSPCIYYRVRKYKKDSRNQWKLTSDVNSNHVPFLVDDGTGQVMVDPSRATVRAKTSHSGVPGEATLAFHGVGVGDVNEKWVEDIIYEGTTLYILGFAQPHREERKSLRERTVEKLRDLKLDRQALHRYDTDNDGQISGREWDEARSDAEQLALKEHLSEGTAGKRQAEHVVITRAPQRGMPFVVAEAPSEAHLVRSYWLLSVPLLVAGLCAALFALYGFLRFLGF